MSIGSVLRALAARTGLTRVAVTNPRVSRAARTVAEALERRVLMTVSLGETGFESPALTAGTSLTTTVTGSAWSFSGSAGIASNGSSYDAASAAPEGSQAAVVGQSDGLVSQSATFTPGAYAFSFSAAQRASGNHGGEDFRVLVDSTVVGTYRPASSAWSRFVTAPVTLTAGSHTVKFQGVDSATGDNAALVDAVAASDVASADLASATYAAAVTADSPLGYWRLGEAAGSTTAADSSGNGRDATFDSAYATASGQGVAGGIAMSDDAAALSDGSHGIASVADSALAPGHVTLEAWVKSPAANGPYQVLASLGGGTQLVTGWGRLSFTVYAPGSGFAGPGVNLDWSKWHHVVGTYDGSVAKLYVDGTLADSQNLSGNSSPAGGFSMGSPGWAANCLSGSLDEVAVYSGALTAAQVKAHYDAAQGTLAVPTMGTTSPASASGVNVSWSWSGLPSGSGVEVQRQTDSGDWVTVGTTFDHAIASVTDSGLAAGSSYRYRARTLLDPSAAAGAGWSAWSAPVSGHTFYAPAFSLAGLTDSAEGDTYTLRLRADDANGPVHWHVTFGGSLSAVDFDQLDAAANPEHDLTVTPPPGSYAPVATATDTASGASSTVALSADGSFASGLATAPGGGTAQSIASSPDGKVYVGGQYTVARFNADGTLDTTFGSGGYAAFLGYAQGLAVTPDGGVIAVGGYGDFNVMKYLPTGQPDPNFGPDHDGYAGMDLGGNEAAMAVALDGQGRIVVGGTSVNGGGNADLAVGRFNADGSHDLNFGPGGGRKLDRGGWDEVHSLSIQPDGKVLAAGQGGGKWVLARYAATGGLDQTFGAVDPATGRGVGYVQMDGGSGAGQGRGQRLGRRPGRELRPGRPPDRAGRGLHHRRE